MDKQYTVNGGRWGHSVNMTSDKCRSVKGAVHQTATRGEDSSRWEAGGWSQEVGIRG